MSPEGKRAGDTPSERQLRVHKLSGDSVLETGLFLGTHYTSATMEVHIPIHMLLSLTMLMLSTCAAQAKAYSPVARTQELAREESLELRAVEPCFQGFVRAPAAAIGVSGVGL